MIDDNMKEELVNELDNLEEQLGKYTKVRIILEQENKSLFRWRCWLAAGFFIIFCQVGATIYSLTLPGDQYVSIEALPFLACFVLAMIGAGIPQRETKACNQALEALYQQDRDEYYKLVTGQERRS